MVEALTWKVLGPEDTHHCLVALDVSALRDVLHKIDAASGGSFLRSPERNEGTVKVLLDLYAHLLMFAKAHGMSPEKTSTLVAIVRELHERSMSERRSRVASYDLLRELIVRHSVARPPYSAAIFDITDVQDIDEYMLSTYYRHYKMYAYAFIPRQTATVRTLQLGSLTCAPPDHFPPLSTALPVAEWKKRMEERERSREEASMAEQLRESEEMAEKRQREAGLNDPTYTDGIKEQLESIRNAVTQRSMDRLDVIEQKLTIIEARVEETMHGGPPFAKGGKKK